MSSVRRCLQHFPRESRRRQDKGLEPHEKGKSQVLEVCSANIEEQDNL